MQPSLLDLPVRFDSGVELTKADHVRLGKQIQRVLAVLSDGRWYSVPELRVAILQRFSVLDPEPSLSAQIRNLRKRSGGSHQIERRRDGNVYRFRLVDGKG